MEVQPTLTLLNATEIHETQVRITNIYTTYHEERNRLERQMEVLDTNLWYNLLNPIILIIGHYKAKYPDARKPTNVMLQKRHFKVRAADEGKEFPFLYQTVKWWKKIYTFPALQDWIESGRKMNQKIIEKYENGDTYEAVLERLETQRVRPTVSPPTGENSDDETSPGENEENSDDETSPGDTSDDDTTDNENSLVEDETNQRNRTPNTSGYLYTFHLPCESCRDSNGYQLFKFGHTERSTNQEEVNQYVRKKCSMNPTVRPVIDLLIKVENSFHLEQQILSDMQQKGYIFDAVNTTTSEFFSERDSSRVLDLIKRRETSQWEYEINSFA